MFQSTRPMRGATSSAPESNPCTSVSIHAPHAGRDDKDNRLDSIEFVSIHAPHAGRDKSFSLFQCAVGVSIHAPHAGRDPSRT